MYEVPAQSLAKCSTNGSYDLSPLLEPVWLSKHNGPYWGRIPNAQWTLLVGLGKVQSTEERFQTGIKGDKEERLLQLVGVSVGLKFPCSWLAYAQDTHSLGLSDTHYGNYMASKKSTRAAMNKARMPQNGKGEAAPISWLEAVGQIHMGYAPRYM